MRPHPAFALALLLCAISTAACSAEYAPTTPNTLQSAGSFLDELPPVVGDPPGVSDLTERLRDSGALSLTSARVGRRTLVTVMAANPFDSPIGECKIIIIDNPTTRMYGPTPLLVGGRLVFSTFVSSPVSLDQVRVTGRLR